MKFIPALNGSEGREIKVKKVNFPNQYKTIETEEYKIHDYAVLELQENLEDDFGYLGINTEENNI